ncbi:MAG: hypothetical protein PHX04_01965 [Bacilli bacterium]|nr:hypothetical protein [Bacilli bacterium]
MRKYVGNKYTSIGICGSFRKHYDIICNTITIFEENGFVVTVPKKDKILKEENGFIIFNQEEDLEAHELEKNYLDKLPDSDCVFVCNPDGYIESTVMAEIFVMLIQGQEVRFMCEPNEEVLKSALKSSNINSMIVSPKELCFFLKTHNEVFKNERLV